MRLPLDTFRLLLISLADCMGQHQRDVIDYLVPRQYHICQKIIDFSSREL